MDKPAAALHGMAMGLDFLRRMEWLGTARVRGYLRLLAVLNVGMLLFLLVTSHGGVDRNGFLLGSDFVSFWTVGRMLGGQSSVYDAGAHIAAQRAYFASHDGFTAFFYPPVFLPFCRPLGLMDYFPALAVWLVATGALYLDALREWTIGLRAQTPRLWLLALAFPAMPIVVTHGQTSFLVAGLLGFAAWLVPVRAAMAGVLFGLATIKPQFGLLVPVALIATREWRVMIIAMVAAAALAGLATLAFGPSIWSEWLAASGRAQEAMASGAVGFGKMVSVFAGLRLVGVPVMAAYTLQSIVAGVVVGLVLRASWKRRFGPETAALMLAGAPLVTPFVLDYDMVLLAFPMLWLVTQGMNTGWRDWEKLAVFLAFVAPAFARPLAMNLSVPIMPLVLGLLFAVLARRATEWRHAHLQPEAAFSAAQGA